MSVGTVLVLGIGSYLLRVSGLILVANGSVPKWASEPLRLLVPAVLGALVVSELLGADGSIDLDARWAGVAAGTVVLFWRRSLVLAMVVAAVSAGLLRWAGLP